MKTIFLIRHAYTGLRAKNQLPETELNKEGLSQANLLADRLKGMGIEKLYSSPFTRALSTANIISEALDLPVLVENSLVETDLWIDPEDLLDDTAEEHELGLKTLQEAEGRFVGLLDEVCRDAQYETVAIVTHGNLIRTVLYYTLQMRLPTLVRLRVSNASITLLHWSPKPSPFFVMERFNDTAHLDV